MRQNDRVKKQQYILIGTALLLFSGLFFLGKTVDPNKKQITPAAANHNHEAHLSFDDLLVQSKQAIDKQKLRAIERLEKALANASAQEQKKLAYQSLSAYWGDSCRIFEPYAYYLSEAAKLDNSEKNLTFAAHLFVERMLEISDEHLQHWLAEQGKQLFDLALEKNPNNDSSKIGLGACYIFGGLSSNPMEGILSVRTIADKNPKNLFAQRVLALGGMKSGQIDKAIERFTIIIENDPDNLEAIFFLAELNERQNNSAAAIQWYEKAIALIPIPEAKKEIQERVNALKKQLK